MDQVGDQSAPHLLVQRTLLEQAVAVQPIDDTAAVRDHVDRKRPLGPTTGKRLGKNQPRGDTSHQIPVSPEIVLFYENGTIDDNTELVGPLPFPQQHLASRIACQLGALGFQDEGNGLLVESHEERSARQYGKKICHFYPLLVFQQHFSPKDSRLGGVRKEGARI